VTGREEIYLGEDRGNPEAFAHMAIDAGASLVIASGPHVLRGMQFYHGH
jgi:Putative enzyme of poly-gamma-glutamate biosynthesis (capsule formation)